MYITQNISFSGFTSQQLLLFCGVYQSYQANLKQHLVPVISLDYDYRHRGMYYRQFTELSRARFFSFSGTHSSCRASGLKVLLVLNPFVLALQ